jgi:Mg2+/Co2+ transporter CorB
MVALSIALPGVVIVLLLACSAFFSSSESAVFSLSAEWVQTAGDEGTPAGRALAALRSDPHRLLVTILVGNNLVNVAVTSILTLLVAEFVAPGVAVLVTTVLTSTLVLVFGEIVPKSYGLGNAETWALRVARPLATVERVLAPVVVLFDVGTRGLTALVGGDGHIEETLLEE